jgi:class 3 adenylate cyclase/tetratricopeptide (TPR) repeat protein
MEKTSAVIPDAYVPIDRREALALDIPMPAEVEGAVLFADITGFTRLTSDLVTKFGDQRGADEITRYLNIIYGALIGRVHDYHGTVISFAGDAITCWFDGDDGLRALAAGAGMQAATEELVRVHQFPLQIKIIIATGPAYRHCVGNPDIQLMDLLAGKTVSRVTSAEKLAGAGDMLVSDDVARRHDSGITTGGSFIAANGDRFRLITALTADVPPSPWNVESRLPEEILSKWLLSAVYEKIRHGEERFLAEIRLTVSLFLKFDGINYDEDQESGRKINRFIAWVQECLARHDGHLLQVIIGDKGDYLFIGFGALAAHENDSSRAIAAARVLREPPDSLSFISGIRIGITLGRMLAGPYGSTDRRTYSMLGASANLAARLMERAVPGQILATERVAIAAQKDYLFDPLGSFRFKGIEQPVPVFELTGSRDVYRYTQLNQSPLVGRKAELQKIMEYAGGISGEMSPGILLMTGEGGIGKTRLLSEVVRQIRDRDITVLKSFGYEIENFTPYYGIRDLFGQLLNTDQYTSDGLLESVSSLVRDINPEWERLLPLLNEILPMELSDNELTSQMYGDVRAGNLHSLLTGIFRKVTAERSCLVILDDAHWLDAASWALLNELADALPRLRLIISFRPFASGQPRDFLRLTAGRPCTEITLKNLSRADIDQMVCQLAGVEDIPEKVLSLIYDKTSGHPFFSEELAYALIASGMLVIVDGHCRINGDLLDFEEISLPDTVQGAIASRLDRMTLPQQLSIKVASIMGRLFVFRGVHEIHPASPALNVLQDQMDAITRMNLIALQFVEPDLAYSFRQSIVHDVAYNLLSYAQRQELHRKAAAWYGTTFANNLSQYYSHLGYHWKQAEDFPKAADYLEKAAFDAIGKGAYRDGIVFIRQTLELEKHIRLTVVRRAVLLMEMGIAHFKIGELGQATTQLKSGIRMLGYPAPSTLPGLGVNLLRQVTRQFIYRVGPKNRALPSEPERNIRLTLSRAYEYLAQSYFHHNQLFYSLDGSLSCLNAAESAGPSAQLARAYASLCITSSTMPFPGLPEEYARLALSLLSDETGLNDHGRILELIAVAWSGRGRWADIEHLCSGALAMATEIGDRFLMMENTCILAACYLPQGKLDESVRLRGELYQIGLQDKNELVQGWALLQLAEISLMNSQFTRTHELLIDAVAVEHALGQPDRIWLHGLRAASFTHLDDPVSARESALQALTLARQSLPTSFFVLEGYSGMMKAFMALGAARPGNRLIRKQTRQALAAFASYAGSFPIGRPRLLFWRGELALRAGHARKARKFWQAGLARATALGMVYEISRLQDALDRLDV